jgi:UDP-N-acetylglucosamine 2-epimerase (non-hydrolysing)
MFVMRKLVLHIVGARPNYMKVAPVWAALEQLGSVEQQLVHTGQHYDREINDVFFDELPLPKPHHQLSVGSGSHGEQTARALVELERLFVDLQPDLVIVPGDVNCTLAAALAAAKLQIAVCHLEAGLRSFDTTMPEEHNRRLTDHLSSLLLTHSEDANMNLVDEGIDPTKLAFVGNTMIDTLLANVEKARELQAWRELGLENRGYVLVTLHRPALVDDPGLMRRTLRGLEEIAHEFPVVFPVHPRTRERLNELVVRESRIRLVPPLSYTNFLSLQTGAAAVVTDSGGVQEETTVLGIPCFTLRDNTERPVTVTHGTNVVLGLSPERLKDVPELLRKARRGVVPPFWDGLAGRRAAFAIEEFVYSDETATVETPARVRRAVSPVLSPVPA